jgi:hypothetical protein
MNTAMGALLDGGPISAPASPKSQSSDFGPAECELTSDELSRLLGEIDSLQLTSLLASSPRRSVTSFWMA